MDKVKIEVPQQDWGSLNTKYPADSNRVADNEFTAGTANVDTSTKGILTKRLGGIEYGDWGGVPKDQYEAIFSDGVRHLLGVTGGILKYTSGDGQIHTVLSGLTATINNEFATTQDRVYFGNGVQKKIYDRVTSYGGVTYTFPTQTVKNMGCQVPGTALSAAGAGSGTGVPAGSYKYKVTYVYYDSEESNEGLESTVVTIGAPEDIALTSIPVGGYGVTQRKIYRAESPDYVDYLLVKVINNNTATTATDNVSAGTTAIPIDNSLPPDFTLISLFLDRLFLAGVPGDPYYIFYSEPGFPDIFPTTNYIPCNQEDPITAIVVYFDRLIVLNRRSMGQILGQTSDQFRYAQIEGSVGCVDNRSVQVRVINGVPVLIWLSDKGFYAYNGSSVTYISDKIEDQVNFNLQQSVIQKNKITHSDYTTFTQGTASNGINLDSSPGQITTKGPYWDTGAHPGATYEEQTNPKKAWDTQSEWEDSNATKTDLVTRAGDNTIQPIKNNRFDSATELLGSLSGDLIWESGQFKLPISTDWTGESKTGTYNPGFLNTETAFYGIDDLAIPIKVPRKGTLTGFSFTVKMTSAVITTYPYTVPFNYELWFDTGGPGGMLKSKGSTVTFTNPFGTIQEFNLNSGVLDWSLEANTVYWLVLRLYPNQTTGPWILVINNTKITSSQYNNAGAYSYGRKDLGAWGKLEHTLTNDPIGLAAGSYSFIADPIAKNGSWISPQLTGSYFDSKAVYNSLLTLSGSFTIPTTWGTKTNQLILESSTDGEIFTQLKTISVAPYSSSVSLSGQRYYRIKVFMSTTDNRETQTATNFRVDFPSTATWISETIDCTSDVTSYDALIVVNTIPSGTSIAYTVATSDDNITYPDGYVAIGSAVVRRYIKVKAVLTKSGDTTVPYISSVLLKWHIAADFVSKSIDTAVTPSGWDIFQTSFAVNGGIVTYYMRSAATEGALSGATWYAVTNGTFPTSSLPTLQWVQWKVEIVTNPDQVPTIDSVTINWFIGSSLPSIRCTSLFYNTNYYLAAAEFESSTNNIIFVFDQEAKWRVYRGLNIAVLSYFFNNPYFGDAVTGKIVKFLESNSDNGAAIEFDFRSRAFDFSTEGFSNDDKAKMLEKVILSGRNTGATYTVTYSVDDGDTFYDLKDKDGNSSFTTSTDGKGFFKWLRPDYSSIIPTGYSIILRIYNNDTNEVEIDGFKMMAFVRKHDPIE